MATTVLSALLRRRRPRRDLRRAVALPVLDSTPDSTPSTSSSSSFSTTASASSGGNGGGKEDDDLLSSLIDHERTGVPAGAGVAGSGTDFDLVSRKKKEEKKEEEELSPLPTSTSAAHPSASHPLLHPQPKQTNKKQSRMHRLLTRLGNPHAAIPATIHVVGSKGKGSTAAMVAAAAGAAGLRVAALSSPHVSSRRERIAFGGGMLPISRVEFDALVEANADALRAAAREEEERGQAATSSRNRLSAFEVMVALGLRAAADRGCDLAVIEAGLGGATDATNVFGGEGIGSSSSSPSSSFPSVAPPPSAVVLSSMSLEHAAALGGSLESVVRAKCGVLRRGVPAVLARQPQQPLGGGGARGARELARAEIERAGAVFVDAAGGVESSSGDSGENNVSVASCELRPSRGRASPPRTKVSLRVSGALAGPFLLPTGGGGGGGGGGSGGGGSLSLDAELRLFGRHQAENAAAAAAAALALSLPPPPSLLAAMASGFGGGLGSSGDVLRRRLALAGRVGPDAVSRGLSGATLPGRFQVVRLPLANRGVRWGRGRGGDGGSDEGSLLLSHLTSSAPPPSSLSSSIPVVLDGAHTPDSAAALARALRAAWPGPKQPKLGIVLACAGDKDLRGIAAALRSPPSSLQLPSAADDEGGSASLSSSSAPPPPLRPSVVVFTEVPVAGGTVRSAPPGELAAAWQAAVMAEPFAGPSGRCRALVKASLGAAVDAAARELTAASGSGGLGGENDDDPAVLVVTGSLHAVGEALRVLPLEEVVGL